MAQGSTSSKRHTGQPSRRQTNPPTLARAADKYDLYQQSVQEPDCEVAFFDRVYRAQFGRRPLVLREDFCGTFAVCCAWAASHHQRIAIGVDLDPQPLAWGRTHNLAKLPLAAQDRVTLLQQDVLKVDRANAGKADVLAAQNFSFYIFKTRDALRQYFQAAHAHLADEGLAVLDMMGGSEVFVENHEDVRRVNGFRYVWEQARFDPISHDGRYHIHFRFRDGSRLNRAFTYDWRLWTLPEVRELLLEAGFSRVDIYWEGTDADSGDGNGIYRRTTRATADPSWVAYVVAVK
jgi:hypothetical protein